MRKLLSLTAALFLCYEGYAQDQQMLDSLLTVLERSKEDSARVELLINICSEKWKYADYAEAKGYADQALALSEKIGYTNGIADAYTQIGIVFWYLNDNTGALDYHQKALAIYEKTGNKKGIARVHNRMGHDYADMNDYPRSLECFQKALELDEELDNKLGIARNLDLIGFVYMNQQDYSLALTYYFKSLRMAESIANNRSIAGVCHDIGAVYEKQGKLSEALRYAKKGLDHALEDGEKHLLDEAYSGLERIYRSMGKYKEAYDARLRFDTLEYELRSADNAGIIKRLQMQHDFESKQAAVIAEQEKRDALAQNELQQQKLVRNIFVGGFIVVLLFAGIFLNQRNKIKRSKVRSDELLLNILPIEVADELKENGFANAKQFDEVTVLFTDFKDFTTITERLTAQELVNEINYCYSGFDKIISAYGIEKIKTIGDAYMCAGGLPVPSSSNAEDTLKAALEILDFMLQEGERRKAAGKTFFEIRIGMHTGPVVAGIVGIKKFAYDIWGDTVNIAARMQSSGETGKVNISGATYELVKHKFKCTYRGKIQAKNKGEIDMYFAEEQA